MYLVSVLTASVWGLCLCMIRKVHYIVDFPSDRVAYRVCISVYNQLYKLMETFWSTSTKQALIQLWKNAKHPLNKCEFSVISGWIKIQFFLRDKISHPKEGVTLEIYCILGFIFYVNYAQYPISSYVIYFSRSLGLDFLSNSSLLTEMPVWHCIVYHHKNTDDDDDDSENQDPSCKWVKITFTHYGTLPSIGIYR
jgi:hypothetical protein